MDTIFTTENSQPTKTLADYMNEGKSFLEAYQAQSPKRLARGKAYEQVEMLKELLNLLHQPDNTAGYRCFNSENISRKRKEVPQLSLMVNVYL